MESDGVWLRVDGSVDSNRRNELEGTSADLEEVPFKKKLKKKFQIFLCYDDCFINVPFLGLLLTGIVSSPWVLLNGRHPIAS